MNAAELKSIQAPLKDQYRNDPASAIITLKATGKIGEGISCKVETGKAVVEAGLHPATGGNGLLACSGDMLMEAFNTCAMLSVSGYAFSLQNANAPSAPFSLIAFIKFLPKTACVLLANLNPVSS